MPKTVTRGGELIGMGAVEALRSSSNMEPGVVCLTTRERATRTGKIGLWIWSFEFLTAG
jgi:hypothetical protein